MILSDELSKLESVENSDHLLFIGEDDRIIRAILAYTRLNFVKISSKTLVLAWQECKVSLREWADLSGLSIMQLTPIYKMLRGNNIILPNGRVNRFVLNYVRLLGVRRLDLVKKLKSSGVEIPKKISNSRGKKAK